MIQMKFFAIISARFYLRCTNASHYGALFTRINPSRALSSSGITNCGKLENDSNQLQTVDALLPKLSEWLACTQKKAEAICALLPKREKIHVKSVEEYVAFLKQNGVTSKMLLDNPWLLLLPPDEINTKLQMLRRIGLHSDTIPLLRLSARHLASVGNQWRLEAKAFAEQKKFRNRLQFFAVNLQCSSHEVAMLMNRHYFVLNMNFQRLERIMHLLLKHGITCEEIKKDLWIFRHNEAMICERIEIVQNEGVDPIKTWMLRCPEFTLRTMLEKLNDKKNVLGNHKDKESYLAERLECNKEDIVAIMKKHKLLYSISMPKVKVVLDFLFENGFTAEQVRSSPRIFGPSIKTVESRMRELEKLEFRPEHLRQLFSTVKDHKRLVDYISKAKKRY